MFKGLIENYIGLLTPQVLQKYACSNGIMLDQQEALQATIFIKQNYKLVFNNMDYDAIVALVNASFNDASQAKMIQLLEITKKKYHL